MQDLSQIYKLPIIQAPTQVIFLDDDRNFLDHLQTYFNNSLKKSKYFDSARDMLDFLSNQQNIGFSNILTTMDDYQEGERNFSIKIANILKLKKQFKKYNKVSVLVIDQNINGFKGLEILEQLREYKFFKILLTGVVDNSQAIEALNNNLINVFIEKSRNDLPEYLEMQIKKGINYYFKSLSEIIMETLCADQTRSTALKERAYYQLLQELIAKLNIEEYYPVDFLGSLYLIDHKSKEYNLLLASSDTIKAQCEFADQIGVHHQDIKKLKKGEMMIYLNYLFSNQSKEIYLTKYLDDKKYFMYDLFDKNILNY